MITFQSPESIPADSPRPWIFLAGSIEQDTAVNWQEQVIQAFTGIECTILNPRRKSWDPSWTHDDSRFEEQVTWELDQLDAADIIMMYFDPATKSPISLLELGLYITANNKQGMNKLQVCCTPEYWRYGNVKIVCTRHGLTLHNSLNDLIETSILLSLYTPAIIA